MSTNLFSTVDAIDPRKRLGTCQYLLFGLLLLIIGSPIGEELFGGSNRPNYVLYATELVVIVGALVALGNSRKHTVFAVVAVIPMVTSTALAVSNDSFNTLHSGLSSILFYAYVGFSLRRYLHSSERITDDSIYGIIAAYMVIALMFAAAYCALELWKPGSFRISTSRDDPGIIYGDLVYFSFVTQTTLGYGDVTPTNEIAKPLAYLQATFGIFFIAIIVAQFLAKHTIEGSNAQDR